MSNKLKHFAIYIDDMDRAKTFYSNLFGWDFNSYGPEDFLQIKDSSKKDAELIGALQSRKYSPLNEKIIGFECSIEVEDIDATITIVEENNGEIVMPKTEIPYVGWLVKFLDTEGNIVCAVQYHKK
ncbi:VOC family protein [Aquimarina aggregata]|uniref:VOC family protein n=1 Tax=Aquimarina aggregata TaxID=1642818 RepID=UPI002491C2A8|nr:VOC family protein [Aquimarina aggregata]